MFKYVFIRKELAITVNANSESEAIKKFVIEFPTLSKLSWRIAQVYSEL